jgi:hypothetical protein
MICNWCGEGSGRNYSRDEQGKIYYYYCITCVGDFKSRCPSCGAEFVTFQTKEALQTEAKIYPCEACQGLVPELRRTRCLGCGNLFCDNHIDDHMCGEEVD